MSTEQLHRNKEEMLQKEQNYVKILNRIQSDIIVAMESEYDKTALTEGQASKEEVKQLMQKFMELCTIQENMTKAIEQGRFSELGQLMQQRQFRYAYLEYVELLGKVNTARIPQKVKRAIERAIVKGNSELKSHEVDFDSMMIAPAQQFPRYPLTLKEMVKNAEGEEKVTLSKSLANANEATKWLDEIQKNSQKGQMLEAKFVLQDDENASITQKAQQAFQEEGGPRRSELQVDELSQLELQYAFDSEVPGNQRVEDAARFMQFIKLQASDPLIDEVIRKYQLEHLKGQNPQMTISDVRALLVGITTNIKPEHFNNPLTSPRLIRFMADNSSSINKMAKEQRKSLAGSMDEVVLKKKNPVARFFLRVGKAIADHAVKANDLKDAFAGVRINKAFEEDIKTVATLEYANTYKAGYSEPQENGEPVIKGISSYQMTEAMQNRAARKDLASGLYQASDLAYRNLNNKSIISVLDADGRERLYQVHNIVKDKGLVCTALVPYTIPGDASEPYRPLDVKILFRGTHSAASAVIDLESTGAGSKTMRDNRIKLLDEVNSLVGTVQQQNPGRPVTLSTSGHSLGGAFAERFTSELHQAIHHQTTTGAEPSRDQSSKVRARIKRNNQEMAGKDYSALSGLAGIKTTAANSARLSKNEAEIGDAFINMTATPQNIQHYKSQGDWVSQAGYRSLGAEIEPERARVSLLRKRAGYGGVTSIHPILGHCDHPFMQYHDKKQRDIQFDYHTNGNIQNRLSLIDGLGSAKGLNKEVQHVMAKIPAVIAEPITWARQKAAKAMGKDPLSVKGFEAKTVAEQDAKSSKGKKP